MLKQNRADYRIAISRRHRTRPATSLAALVRRRNKAVRLVEEFNLRTERLQPLWDKLVEISDRMQAIRCEMAEFSAAPQPPDRHSELRASCTT